MCLGLLEMSKTFAIARGALAALIVFASCAVALCDVPPARTRVTIRGSGSSVTIERTQAPARRVVFERKAVSPDALAEAIHLKTEGVSDGMLVAYLRAHEAELPPVIEAAAMTRLRKAGAGKSVAAYLVTVAAVDIGETGEGWGPAVSNAYSPEAEAGMPAYDMTAGYSIAGSYAFPYPTRRRNHAFSVRHAPFPHRQPVLHRAFPSRIMPGRRRME
jgi:hypothetical protein